MTVYEPITQSNADDRAHDRTSVIHRLASDRQKWRERQEGHTVHAPCEPQTVDGQSPFTQTPRAWRRRTTLEPSDDDEQGWQEVGGVKSQG